MSREKEGREGGEEPSEEDPGMELSAKISAELSRVEESMQNAPVDEGGEESENEDMLD
jgi:hypothetical protein